MSMSTEMMWDIANNISAVIGWVISAFLVARFYFPYVKKKYSAIVIGAVYGITMTFLYFIPFIMPGIAAYWVGFIMVFAASVIFDRRNIPQKAFLALTIYMFLWIAKVTALMPWKLISNVTYMRPDINGEAERFLLFIVALFFLVGIESALLALEIFITDKFFLRKNERMEWREFTILVAPYIAVISGYWISTFMADAYETISGEYIWNNYPIYDVIRALFGIIAFLAVITVIHSYQIIKKSQEDALQSILVAKQVEELSGHVHGMEKLYSDIRAIRHDVNDHIMILGNLLGKNETGEAVNYLKEWQNGFPMPEISVKTGNPVTDIVLSEKKREAEEAGIVFLNHFHYPFSGKLESIDVGIILINALSNAIRAASDSTAPEISIKSWKHNNAFLIQVENSFDGALVIDPETGFPLTSKNDKDSHGYGLKNIKRITKKYFGTIQIEQNEDRVILTVMVVIPS